MLLLFLLRKLLKNTVAFGQLDFNDLYTTYMLPRDTENDKIIAYHLFNTFTTTFHKIIIVFIN